MKESWLKLFPYPVKKDYTRNLYNYIKYQIPYKFFAPALVAGVSLESERQQVSSGLQDFS